ncbi:MAG: 3-phosphoshikimate 1-carboxyvinyltransferase [Candidatus Omnitrophica bacterium]|nr:3-phosphoshikimate 1-carboxyvinyltransferase [Candidatus Omnitrophota bacterium]
MRCASRSRRAVSSPQVINPSRGLQGSIRVPSDKSVSHRALMLSAVAEGQTRIHALLAAGDCLSTRDALMQMGVRMDTLGQTEDRLDVLVHGVGLHGLREPQGALNAGNSGTTLRLMLGLLAGCPWQARILGDESLSRRPMDRVALPLRQMGASVAGQGDRCTPPLQVRGTDTVKAIAYQSPVASAQVKSCVLLAGLFAKGTTSVELPRPARDHTERMLEHFGVPVEVDGLRCSVSGPARLRAKDLVVPGDLSSAMFFLVAGSLVPGSQLVLEEVGLNPTRRAGLDILERMGADLQISFTGAKTGEPVGRIEIKTHALQGVEVGPDEVAVAIDELPILMVAATQAEGLSCFRGAGELRVKETDRIASMTEGLRRMGAKIEVRGEDIRVQGPVLLQGASVESFGDHRTAMSLAVAGLVAKGKTQIQNPACVSISYPAFFNTLSFLSPV